MLTDSHGLNSLECMKCLLSLPIQHVLIYIKRLESKNQNLYLSTYLKCPLFLWPVHCLLECFPKALQATSPPLREAESPKITSLHAVTSYCIFVWWTDIAVRTNTPLVLDTLWVQSICEGTGREGDTLSGQTEWLPGHSGRAH